MLRSMQVGLDGSAYSERAAELGIEWARRFDALLVGMGVVDEPTIRGPLPVVRGVPSAESVACALEQARVEELGTVTGALALLWTWPMALAIRGVVVRRSR